MKRRRRWRRKKEGKKRMCD